MLATTEEIQAVEAIQVKTMSTKDLVGADLPDEDHDDHDYQEMDHEMDDDDEDEDAEDIDEDDEDDEPLAGETDIEVDEVNDLQRELASMQNAKVLRSGLKAAGNYRNVTIHDIAGDDEDDEEYEDAEEDDEEEEDDEDDEEDEDAEEDDEDVDEEEVKDNIINAGNLPTKAATILRDGKELPTASETEIDLVARMQQLMQQ